MPKDIAFILYNTPEHSEKVQVVIREETLWMTQKAMSELFGCSPDNISLHLKNIYEAGELQAEATSEKISVVQTEGSRQVNRATLFYNLEPPHLVVGDAALVGDFSSILHRCVHLVDDLLGLGGT